MDKTNIKACFNIIGADFDPIEVSNLLSINPTEYWKKNDKVKNRNIRRKECCWSLCTKFKESYDINDQLTEIVNQIKIKKDILKNLNNIEYFFELVIKIENNESPAIYLERETLDFANEIKAEFNFDLYIYS